MASSTSDASWYTQRLKKVVEQCSFYARIVCTGSGMVSLLTFMRASPPNGFMLWHALDTVSLGHEPSAPAALAIAEGILAPYAAKLGSSKWPAAVAQALSPQCVVGALARSAHSEATSPRPALVAYLASLVGDGHEGSPEVLLAAAQSKLLNKLGKESMVDLAVGLSRIPPSELRTLRALADGRPGLAISPSDHFDEFAKLLCEPSLPLRLLPPYGALMRNWVTPGGTMAVSITNGAVDLAHPVRKNLVAIHSFSARLTDASRAAAASAVLEVVLRNGIGVVRPHAAVRAPLSLVEVASIPAIRGILLALDSESIQRGRGHSGSWASFSRALAASPEAQARYFGTVWFEVVLWLRHVEARVSFPVFPHTGFSCAVVEEIAFAARDAIVSVEGLASKL